MAAGSWFGLPELGLSETFGGNKKSTVNQRTNSYVQPAYQNSSYGSSGTVYVGPSNVKKTGKVAGISTGPSSTSSVKQQSYDDLSSLESEAKSRYADEQRASEKSRNQIYGEIDSAYNPLYQGLAQRETLIPQEEMDLNSLRDTGYAEQQSAINSGLDLSRQQLGLASDNVMGMKVQGQRDLANDLNSAFSAANQRLGSVGASDSSAAGMYSYALAKQGNRQSANLQSNANNQLAQIDLKVSEAVKGAQDKLAEVETWKANKTYEIGQYIRGLKQELMSARSEIDSRKAGDRTNLAIQGYQQAMSRLQQINDLVINTKAQIQQDVRNNVLSMQNYKQQLAAEAQYTPQAMQYNPINLGDGTAFQSQTTAAAPIAYNNADDSRKKTLASLYGYLG